MSVMSDKLKETLGIMDKQFDPLPANSYEDAFEAVPDDQMVVMSREVAPFVAKNVPTTIPESENSDLREDYITSRNITHTLIDMTGKALTGALDVATESQHPKAFSVFNELASTMRLLAKDLIEMQAIYKEISAEKAQAKVIHATQNNVTINPSQPTVNVSLADVLKMLEDGEQAVIDAQTVDVKEDNGNNS